MKKTTAKPASSLRIAAMELLRQMAVMGDAGGFSAPKSRK